MKTDPIASGRFFIAEVRKIFACGENSRFYQKIYMLVISAVQTPISSSTTAVVPLPRWGRLIENIAKYAEICFEIADELENSLESELLQNFGKTPDWYK